MHLSEETDAAGVESVVGIPRNNMYSSIPCTSSAAYHSVEMTYTSFPYNITADPNCAGGARTSLSRRTASG